MPQDKNQALEMFRKKFETYKKIMDAEGEQKAWDTLFEGYPERQKKNMGPLIENTTLADGFSKAIPLYKQIGMEMEVVDISNKGIDAVLEIQKVCPVMGMAKEYGFDEPCHVICEMDIEATKAAFPGTKGEILCAQARGAAVCLFKYERPGK
ncbi:MAG: transcriptional regulator [Candidatus Schekmanbacteria bacterium]|nr:MAG: transcriptional regulator [Candidatus Schekmanbacteria bacterium]